MPHYQIQKYNLVFSVTLASYVPVGTITHLSLHFECSFYCCYCTQRLESKKETSKDMCLLRVKDWIRACHHSSAGIQHRGFKNLTQFKKYNEINTFSKWLL